MQAVAQCVLATATSGAAYDAALSAEGRKSGEQLAAVFYRDLKKAPKIGASHSRSLLQEGFP